MLPYFIEPFKGYLIRIGAKERPQPYRWCLPLSESGEFVGVSTHKLSLEAVRTAIEAAKFLGIKNPHWLHKEKDMSKHGIPSVHSTSDGKEQAKVLRQVADLVESGKVTLTPIAEHALADGGTMISFVRHEH